MINVAPPLMAFSCPPHLSALVTVRSRYFLVVLKEAFGSWLNYQRDGVNADIT